MAVMAFRRFKFRFFVGAWIAMLGMPIAGSASPMFNAEATASLLLMDISSTGAGYDGLEISYNDDSFSFEQMLGSAVSSVYGRVRHDDDPLGLGIGFDSDLMASGSGKAYGPGSSAENERTVLTRIRLVNSSTTATFDLAYRLAWSIAGAISGVDAHNPFTDALAEAGVELQVGGIDELFELETADLLSGLDAFNFSGELDVLISLVPGDTKTLDLVVGTFGFAVPLPATSMLLLLGIFGLIATRRVRDLHVWTWKSAQRIGNPYPQPGCKRFDHRSILLSKTLETLP